ncbi:hypothetical protein U9M48_013244 [Paspalum notatum var. saurae]|uniref:Uncharacterized protein n=1 Tax=Paspalum notatum var. saurae TaxID=547442 RepID=A0AAQ3SZ48_PASNO
MVLAESEVEEESEVPVTDRRETDESASGREEPGAMQQRLEEAPPPARLEKAPPPVWRNSSSSDGVMPCLIFHNHCIEPFRSVRLHCCSRF